MVHLNRKLNKDAQCSNTVQHISLQPPHTGGIGINRDRAYKTRDRASCVQVVCVRQEATQEEIIGGGEPKTMAAADWWKGNP